MSSCCSCAKFVADAFCRGAAGSDECSKIFVGAYAAYLRGPAVAGAPETASPCAHAGTSTGKVLVVAGSSPISLVGSFDAAATPITCIDVHRTTLVTACDAGDVGVWDAASHASLFRFPGVAGCD